MSDDNDDDVIDLGGKVIAFDYLPDAVRREMERRKQAGEDTPEITPLADDATDGVRPDGSGLGKKSDPMPVSPLQRYQPHAGMLNRIKAQERVVYFMFKDCTYRAFAYSAYVGHDLVKSATPGGGLEVVVWFNTGKREEVRIRGRNLRFMAECIGLGVMPWIWEKPDSHDAGDGGTVITEITVTEIER